LTKTKTKQERHDDHTGKLLHFQSCLSVDK